MDREIFLSINHWRTALGPFILFFSVALNLLWVKLVFLLIVIGMLVRNNKTRYAIILTLVAVALANSLTDIMKTAFPMHRPFQPEELGHQVILRVGYANTMGTASGHSANMGAVAVMLTLCLGKWGYPWIAIALITGFSRVYVGAHYPWQVLFGWCCGIFASAIVYKLCYREYMVTGSTPVSIKPTAQDAEAIH